MAHRPATAVPAGARDLTQGNPDPALLPDLGRAVRELRPLQRLYGEPGHSEELLRLAGADFASDGIPFNHLLVVGGALDGMERALAAHLRQGDRVVVEDPGYPAISDLLLALGLVAQPVPVDDAGYLPEALEAALRGTVRALISTTRAQNPTGAAVDEERARELRAAIARRPDVLLIEDDHAGLVAGAPMIPLCAASPERWAVVRSVSKSLGPDLRLAVMAGDAVTISRVEGRQQLGVGWVSHLLQDLVVALWQDTATQQLLRRAAEDYAERRQALIRALGERGLTGHGRSGFNVWVPVPDEAAAVRSLLDAGWAVAPGERFRHSSGPAVRISIGSLRPEETPALAETLALLPDRRSRTRLA